MRAVPSASTSPVSRPTCSGATRAARAASAPAIPRRADIGRRIRSSPPCAGMGSARRPCSTGRPTTRHSSPTWNKSSCPRCAPATSLCWIISGRTSSWMPHRDRTGRRAPAVPPALQSRLQSDRAGLRQAESIAAGGATAQLRPGCRTRGDRARPLPPTGVREFRAPLRLPCRYIVMKRSSFTKTLLHHPIRATSHRARSQFRVAYVGLAGADSNIGQATRAIENATKAFALRERVSERERRPH